MADKKRIQRSFKPVGVNKDRLDYAEQIGINPGDVINEALNVCGKEVLEKLARERLKLLRRVVTGPIP